MVTTAVCTWQIIVVRVEDCLRARSICSHMHINVILVQVACIQKNSRLYAGVMCFC